MRSIGYLLLLTALCAGFTSCQKEITGAILLTDSTGGGGTVPPSTNGNLLVKNDGRSGSDSNVTTYTYNSAKRVIATYNVISSNGGSTTYYGFDRDSAGLIIKRKQFTTSGLFPASPDTSVTVYRYSTGATKQIVYSTTSITSGITVDDSTVYLYNTSGKLTQSTSYQASFLTGLFEPALRSSYTYDAAGNVAKLEMFSFLMGVAVPLGTSTFTYDNKAPAATYTEAEAIAITDQPAELHNPVSYTAPATPPVPSISVNYTYTYNSNNRPATAVQKLIQGSTTTTTNSTLYYQ